PTPSTLPRAKCTTPLPELCHPLKCRGLGAVARALPRPGCDRVYGIAVLGRDSLPVARVAQCPLTDTNSCLWAQGRSSQFSAIGLNRSRGRCPWHGSRTFPASVLGGSVQPAARRRLARNVPDRPHVSRLAEEV